MENQRIRLTKKMLKEALLHLLSKKAIDKISIYELCKEAQINRTTFYKYYGSQNELLDELENDFLSELESIWLEEDKSLIDGIKKVLMFLAAESEKYRILINAVWKQDFPRKFFALSAIDEILESHINPNYTDGQKAYYRIFFCYGSYAIICRWLMKENRETVDEIVQLLIDMFICRMI